jgi:hypothetical protein
VAIILLVPVTDYAKFIAQLKPESTTDQVTKVKFFKDDSWVRNVGGYAALCGPPFRSTLEKLTVAAEVPAALKPWSEWIASRDAAGVLLPAGLKRASSEGQKWLQIMKLTMGQAGEQGKQAVLGFTMYEKLLQASEKEAGALGLGLQFDKQSVLRVTTRLELTPEGNWAKTIAQSSTPKESLLAGLPGGSFVAAGGAAISDAILSGITKSSIDLMKSMPEVYGLSEEQIGKIADLGMAKFKGIRSISAVMGASKSGDPLYGNTIVVMKVENSKAFMDSYEEYFKQYNEILKDAKSSLMQPMKFEKSEVGGVAGFRFETTLPKQQANLPQAAQAEKMMELMFGPGGKIIIYLAPADEHTILMGYISKEPMEHLMASLKQNPAGLAAESDVSKTAAMLPTEAPLVVYISPQGAIDFMKRTMAAILPPGMAERVNIPDFPATPPLGFAVKTAPNEVQTTLVVPVEVFQAIGKYIQHFRGMSRGDVSMDR